MKRLYISDLDGTLLDENQTVTEKTAEILRECTANGVYFTFATARTAASALKITDKIGVNVPCVLMNGVSIYDTVGKKYIKNEYFPSELSRKISVLLDELGQSGFMYKISRDMLSCEYTSLDNPEMRSFYEIRRSRYDKPFDKIESFSASCDENVIYFALLDSKERLERVHREIDGIKGLKYEFYRDIYSCNSWYLEIFSEKASKYNGVEFLREHYGFDEVICFGDNLNDIPMFEASDRKVAVSNAGDRVKEIADAVIGSNLENSVAEYINADYRQ